MSDSAALLRLAGLFEAGGFGIRKVGGCVRDALLGVEPKDVDLATDADVASMMALAKGAGFKVGKDAGMPDVEGKTPEEIRALAAAAGFGAQPRLLETGLKHGTLTFVVDKEPFEVTMLRVDVACDGRHAEVAHTTDWRTDAARRDLTINAMSMDFAGRIYDYFGGREDLEARRIRLVGDPDARLQEDYLRILRVFRFVDKFPPGAGEPGIEPATEAAVGRNVAGLERISAERIWAEMGKILTGPRAAALVGRMDALGVNRVTGMPWTDPEAAAEARLRGASAVAMLASQLSFAGDAEALAAKWRFSTEEADRLAFLVSEKRRVCDRRVEDLLVDGRPRAWVVDLARLSGAGEARAASFDPPVFPVFGRDLLRDLGMSPGPEVGLALKQMRAAWTQSRFTLGREELVAAYAEGRAVAAPEASRDGRDAAR